MLEILIFSSLWRSVPASLQATQPHLHAARQSHFRYMGFQHIMPKSIKVSLIGVKTLFRASPCLTLFPKSIWLSQVRLAVSSSVNKFK